MIADVRALVAAPTTTTLEADGLWLLGRLEWTVGNLDAARECIERTISIVQALGDQSRLAHALIDKGWLCFLRGKNDERRHRVRMPHSSALTLCLTTHSWPRARRRSGLSNHRAGTRRPASSTSSMRSHTSSLVNDEGPYAKALLNIAAVEVFRPDPDLDRVRTCARPAPLRDLRDEEQAGAPPRTRWQLWRPPAGAGGTQGRSTRHVFGGRLACAPPRRCHGRPWTLGRIAALRIEKAPAKTAEILGHTGRAHRGGGTGSRRTHE